MKPDKAYLIRVWDDYASSTGDWINECVCLTPEKAREEQDRLARRGLKTNITSIRLLQ